MSGGARVVAADAEAATRLAARWLAERIARIAHDRDTCAIALAGGATPRQVYARLASAPLADAVPWTKVDLYFGDERCVPPDHPASNFRMACEALHPLLAGGGRAGPRLHRIEAERPDADAAAADYDAAAPPRYDMVLLGVGADGHTASLFPGPALLEPAGRGYAVVTAPTAPPRRITLTAHRLANAGILFVLATGAAKADAVARALCDRWDPAACPAQLARRGTWIVDAAAATRLNAIAPEGEKT